MRSYKELSCVGSLRSESQTSGTFEFFWRGWLYLDDTIDVLEVIDRPQRSKIMTPPLLIQMSLQTLSRFHYLHVTHQGVALSNGLVSAHRIRQHLANPVARFAILVNHLRSLAYYPPPR